MKSFMHKFRSSPELEPDNAAIPPPAALPQLGLREHQRRSLIGWIARRLGQLLRVEGIDSGAVLLDAYAADYSRKAEPVTAMEELLTLASWMANWLESGQDVHLELMRLKLSDVHQRAARSVYEELKDDMPFCFLTVRKETDDPAAEGADWEVYRDVMYAVTQQKFLLIRESDVAAYLEGEILCEASILERSDIPKARDLAKQSLTELGISGSTVMSHLLVISEAITNILKHAISGRMTVVATDAKLHAIVEDKGPGFALKQLPYMTLMAGYSTKQSLGQGFTLMMKMADQVLLSTVQNQGSTLILCWNRTSREGETHGGRQNG